jgi:outer membrane receptor protein involved in Fe transport
MRPFAASLVALAVTTPALAQTDDVIVITASRQAEDRSATSTPVAVLSAAEIERLGSHHAAEALNRLPGVFVHRGNGVEHLTAVRSAVLTGGAGAGSFLYLQDGIGLRAPGFANINGLMEAPDGLAEQIEVIRGPGGPAYGSNALHGLINVITPDPATAGSVLELEAGSFGRARIRANAGGETHFGAAFGGFTLRREDGWRDDAGLLQFTTLGRLDGEFGQTNWSLRGSLVDIDQETATFVRGFEAYRDEDASRRNADPEAFRNVRAARASLHLDRPLSEQLSLNAVIYGRSNAMDFRLHFLPSEALETTGHDSLGFQSALTWQTERTRAVFGLDADFTTGTLFEFQDRPTVGPFVQGLHYDYEVEAQVFAAFGQLRHALTDTLTLEGGARVESTSYEYDNRAPDGAVGRYLRPSDRSDDFSTFAPSLGATWQVSETVQLFSRAARGVRAPQTAELYRLQPGQVIDGIDPEELDSLEAGVRFDTERGRIELVGFAMEKQNVFFRDANGINVTDGETRHRGFELDAVVELTDTLTAAVSASWAEHEYAFDRTVRNASEVIVEGARLDTAPDWLWNARLVWSPTSAFEIEGEWVHVGEYFANAANTATYDGHDLLNLRTRYSVSDRVELFGAVRNLTDERYAERADFAFGSYRYFPGEPRGVSVGLRIRG